MLTQNVGVGVCSVNEVSVNHTSNRYRLFPIVCLEKASYHTMDRNIKRWL
jgi:hypothetical protein